MEFKSSFINNEQSLFHKKNLIVRNKETGEVLAELSHCNSDELDSAYEGALDARSIMMEWSAGDRSAMISQLIVLLERNFDQMSELISKEAGKPISYAKGEVSRCISTLLIASEEAKRFSGEVVPMDFNNGVGKTAHTKWFSKGVVCAISPFNFPLNLALHKIAAAFAVGTSVVLKPSPYTPLSALFFAHLVKEAGYPKGALNVLICDNEVAQKMVEDERAKVFSFTGSPSVGWHLKSLAGKKKVILELGGNAACIVDRGVDIKEVAKSLAIGAYLYSGQICISTQRIIAREEIYDELLNELKVEIDKLSVGSLSDERTIVGPLIDEVHCKRILDWIEDAAAHGAYVECGGNRSKDNPSIILPTLITNVNHEMKVYKEEVFGPVATIEKFSSIEEAFHLVNKSDFGLQVGFFTNNLEYMKMAHDKLDVGGIIMNGVPGFRIDNMPYGGVKDSGLGREGLKYTMQEVSEPRLLIY